MHICQLINDEIQKISESRIAPKEYDELIDRVSKEIEKLRLLTKILNLQPESLSIIDEYCNENDTHVNITKLKDVFADKVENITDLTIFYEGDLSFKDYQRLNPKSTKLPDSLKVIFGNFIASETNIEVVDLQYVEGLSKFRESPNLTIINIYTAEGGVDAQFCESLFSIYINKGGDEVWVNENKLLQTISVGDVHSTVICTDNEILTYVSLGNVDHSVAFMNCYSLLNLTMGNITGDLWISNCDSLKLKNISSQASGKITVLKELRIYNSTLKNLTNEEIHAKFDVQDELIIKDS